MSDPWNESMAKCLYILRWKTMKVWEADVLDAQSKEEPGTIVEVTKRDHRSNRKQ